MKKIPAVPSLSLVILFLALISAPYAQAQTWSTMASGTTEELFYIWGKSSNDIFSVGASGTILHYNGIAWASMESGVTYPLKKVAGNATIFAVGADGSVIKYNGTTWAAVTTLPKPEKALSDVWGTDISNLIAVGIDGAIEKIHFVDFFNAEWVSMNSGTTGDLNKVWGIDENDVFAVGSSGNIVHYNGNSSNNWTAMSSGTDHNLYGLWGYSGSNAFAVGAGGTILHYDGSAWAAMTSPTTSDLADIWTPSGAEAFAVGSGGEILHYNGSAWAAMTSPTTSDLNKVWCIDNHVFAVGKNGTILHYRTTSTTTTLLPGGSTTTTTTGGQNTSTVTTTTTTIPQCLFRRSVADGKKVQSLRELRNQKLHTAIGAMLATMYYQNMDDIAAVLKDNGALNTRFRVITSKNMPAVKALVLNGSTTISSADAGEIHEFLIDLQAQAGLKLSMEIDFILRGFESGWLPGWLGITIEQGQ